MEPLLLLSKILMINLVLSGDNAVIIALASKDLPIEQRKQAVWWGALGAVVLRCILTWVAALLLQVPYIQAIGGLILAFIAFKLLLGREDNSRVEGATTMRKAIWTILAADFVMSLDNVLAIAAIAAGDVALLIIGIVISIPIVVWGSNLIAEWLHRFPFLVFVGAAILAYTAGEMLLHDLKMGPAILRIAPGLAHNVPYGFAVLVIMVGWWSKYKRQAY